MMRIKVSFKSGLSTLAKQSQMQLQMQLQMQDGASLDELIKRCLAENDGLMDAIAGDQKKYKAVFVCNGRFCDKNHLLKDGDEISVYPKISGG